MTDTGTEKNKTYREALLWGEKKLAEAGIQEAGSDAWLLFSYVLKISRAQYYLKEKEEMPKKEDRWFRQLLEQRCQRIPLQQITGEQEFMGFPFQVNEHVLIPRQETELLVEEAVKRYSFGRILDLCTGSGCIMISTLKLLAKKGFPPLCGVGSDLSEEALKIARKNAGLLAQEEQEQKLSFTFVQGDLFEPVTGTFGMILSNPPYIKSSEIPHLMKEVREFEPMMALDGKEDGLFFYRKILSQASAYLETEGWLLVEIGYDQGEAVKELFLNAGFMEIEIRKDYAGLDRIVSGKWKGLKQ